MDVGLMREKRTAGRQNIRYTRLGCDAEALMAVLLVTKQQKGIKSIRKAELLPDAGDKAAPEIGINLSGKDLPCDPESIIH